MKKIGAVTLAATSIALLLISGCSNGVTTPAQTSVPIRRSSPPTPPSSPTSTFQLAPGDGPSVAGFRANPQRTGFFKADGGLGFGELKWKFEIERAYQRPNLPKYSTYPVARVLSSPAVVDGVAYVGSDDLHLYAIDTETGQLKWRFLARPDEYQLAGPVQSSPTIGDGTIFFGTMANHLFAVDLENGEKRWQFKTGGAVLSSPAIAISSHRFPDPQPA